MNSSSSQLGDVEDECVAIVGIGCRFPGHINDVNTFWKAVVGATDCTSKMPKDRFFDASYYYHPTPRTEGKMYNRRGGYVDSETFRKFDRQFFRMSPAEANHLDPQIRMLLEVTWEALEDAGMPPNRHRGTTTGVYVGLMNNDYNVTPETTINAYTNSGTDPCMASNRLSYEFDFRGPSYTIDTACSSSLYAVHQACEGIRRGDCEMAIAGGSNLVLRPETSIGLSQAQMVSPDGRCKTFDASADGYSRSEGAGVVVLKSLRNALESGDPIYAAIRGGAMGNDGKTHGVSQPSSDAQIDLLARACRRAGIRPEAISYVEAHGTGTQAGDRAEATALGVAIGRKRATSNAPPLYVGSVKSNIGHTEGAAGVAGVIKAALVLAKKKIPPSIHFRVPNPSIPFEALHVQVCTDVIDLPTSGFAESYVGCSSFGFGGANAHVILQESPIARRFVEADDSVTTTETVPETIERSHLLLLLSAASSSGLKDQARNWINFLKGIPSQLFPSVVYSAACRSQHHSHRLALVVRDSREAMNFLTDFLEDRISENVVTGGEAEEAAAVPVVFAFSGMGTQWWAMGRQLLNEYPTFCAVIKEIDEHLCSAGAAWSLFDVLTSSAEASIIHLTEISQPCIFAIEVAIVEVLREFGVNPTAVVGHSVGEVATAYTAGLLTLKQASTIIYHRGRLLERTSGRGGMLAVLGDATKALSLLPKDLIAKSSRRWIKSLDWTAEGSNGKSIVLDVAAINSSRQIVLSGDEEALKAAAAALSDQDGVRTVSLKVNNAFHSYQQSSLQEDVLDCLSSLENRNDLDGAVTVPMVSSVTAEYVNSAVVGKASYWWENVRQTVRFQDAVKLLLKDGYTNFVEIGAHCVLTPAIKDILSSESLTSVSSSVIPTLKRPKNTAVPSSDETACLLRCVARLHVMGAKVDFSYMYPEGSYSFVPLPRYPWQREECWFKTKDPPSSNHPLLGERQPSIAEIVDDQSKPSTIIWKCEYSAASLPWLKDHAIVDVIAPAAAYVETGLAAAKSLFGDAANFSLTDVAVKKFMFAPNSSADVRVTAEESGKEEYRLGVHSRTLTTSAWQTHATMTIRKSNDERDDDDLVEDLESLKRHFSIVAKASKEEIDIYASEEQKAAAYKFGPAFRVCHWAALSRKGSEILVRATITEEIRHELHRYTIHPAFLDCCFQAYLIYSDIKYDSAKSAIQVPTFVESCEVYRELPSDVFVHLKEHGNENGHRYADVSLIGADDGRISLKLNKVIFRSIASSDDDNKPHFWTLKWAAERREQSSDGDASARAVSIMWFRESQLTIVERLLLEFKERNIRADAHFVAEDKGKNGATSSYTDIVMLLMDVSERDVFEATTKADFLNSALASPLAFIKALQLYGFSWDAATQLRIWLVTRNGQAVRDGEIATAGQATVAGCLLSLSHEMPDRKYFWLDLESAGSSKSLLHGFIDYFLNFAPDENEVALRRDVDPNKDSFATFFPRLTQVNHDAVSSRLSDADWTVAYSSRTKQPILTILDRPDCRYPVTVNVNCFSPLPRLSSQTFPGAWVVGEVASCCANGSHLAVGDTVLGLSDSISCTVSIPLSLAVKVSAETKLSNVAIVNAVQKMLIPLITFTVALPLGSTVLVWANPSDNLQAEELTALSKLFYWLQVRGIFVHDSSISSGSYHDSRCTLRDLGSVFVSGQLASAVIFLDEIGNNEADQLLRHLKPFGSCVFYSIAQSRRFIESEKAQRRLVNFVPMMTTQDVLDERYRDLVRCSLINMLKRLKEETTETFNGSNQVEPERLRDFPTLAAALQHTRTFSAVSETINLTLPDEDSFAARSGDSYLITGGLKGFGLSLAKWLVNRGARHLHLLGRSPPGDQEAVQIEQLKAKSQIDIWKVDITSGDAMESIFQKIFRIGSSTLAGIFHCAAVYHDSLILAVDKDQMEKVVLPKAYGAWLLHQKSLAWKAHLRYFVLFSSVVSLFGNSGQVSYCIANTVLNSLAEHRKRLGLPAISLQFGAISGAGYLQQNPKLMALMKSRGLSTLSDQSALDCLGRAMLIQLPSLCVQGKLNAEKYVRLAKPGTPFRFSRIKELEKSVSRRVDKSSQISFSLLAPHEKREVALDLLSTWLVASLGVDEVPSNTSLVSIGFDSIMATEMSDRIQLAFDVAVPPVRMLNDRCSLNFLVGLVTKLCHRTAEKEERHDEVSAQDPWRYPLNDPPKNEALCHLLCFPPNAAGVSAYARWGRLLEDSGIAVTVLQFPGWEGRQTEACIGDLDGLVSAALDAVLPLAEKEKLAFYGHSMGGLIAYEVALRLKKDHAISIAHFFVGALHAPHLPYPRPAEFDIPRSVFKRDAPLSVVFSHLKQLSFIDLPPEMDPTQNMRALSLLRDWMPCFEIALRIFKTYIPNENTVPCGIDAFSSTGDACVSPKYVMLWGKHSQVEFFHLSLDAPGHQFTNLFANEICETIKGRLKTLLLENFTQ